MATTFGKFKVLRDNQVNQGGSHKKTGDIIELSAPQAKALGTRVEPVDDVAKAMMVDVKVQPDFAPVLEKLRDHEKLDALAQHRESLAAQLKDVDARIDVLKAAETPSAAPKASPKPAGTK